MYSEVIRRIELLVLKTVQQHGNRAVVFGAGYPAGVVLASEQPALPVPAVAVAVIRGVAKHGNLSRILEPTQHTVVGDVAEEQIPPTACLCRGVPRRCCRLCISRSGNPALQPRDRDKAPDFSALASRPAPKA